MSSPSALIKVNCLVMRYLHFGSVRGDLQEGNVYGKRRCGYASRCQLALFPMTIPVVSSTKSGFLCFFGLRDPRFRAFQAQNLGFCVRTGNFPQVFAPPEHKIGVFVLGDGHRVSVSAITGADSLSLACPTASEACPTGAKACIIA